MSLKDRKEFSKDVESPSSTEGEGFLGQKATFSDHVYVFWRGHTKMIYGVILGIFLIGLIGLTGYGWKQWSNHRMGQKFLAALEQPQQLESFANDYHSSPLGGFAQYLLGNRESMKGNNIVAAHHYKKAASAWNSTSIDGIAQLISGIEQVKSNDFEHAKETFKKLGHQRHQLSVIRAGAWYELALIYYQEEDFKNVEKALSALDELPFTGIFGEKANLLAISIGHKPKYLNLPNENR